MADPRILIVRLSAIGDTIQTMPVACALRERFPQAFLAWAVESRAAALVRGHPALDELIELPRGWLKSPRGVWRLRRRLRAMRFDATVDVQSLTKSAVLAWLAGAPRRIGFGNPGGRELSQWFNNERVDPKAVHVVDCYLELLRPFGIESPVVRFDVPEREEDRAAADAMLGQLVVEDGFAMVTPGAGWASKLWPADRHAAVVRHLHAAWRLPTIVVWAGPSERLLAERIAASAPAAARLAPATTLPQLGSLARRARLFIGSDTGPLHLAAAVGAPCVGLYGPWPASRHGPYGSRNIALQQMIYNGPTRGRRTAPPIYMESITTEMACEACDAILRREA